MELIQSFSVDHTRIVPGIFTSRVDTLGDYAVTTYDVRLKRPNREPVIDVGAMHSLEHIIATFLRNDPDWKDEVIYWGPMGCLTGFYLILKGSRAPRELPDAQPGDGQVVRPGVCRLSGGQRRKRRYLCLSPDRAPCDRGRTAFLRLLRRLRRTASCGQSVLVAFSSYI